MVNKHLHKTNTLWWLNSHREVLKTLLIANYKSPSELLSKEIDFFSQKIKELKIESESL